MKTTHCKLKKTTQGKLPEYFVLEVTARPAADILGIQAGTVILFYRKIRLVIRRHLALEAEHIFEGCAESDGSCFGGKRKGKRGRGAAGKVAAFGILKRGGKVYTAVVDNAGKEILLPVITKKIMPDSVVYTDSPGSYDVLVSSSQNQSWQTVCRQTKPHQRYWKLLESG